MFSIINFCAAKCIAVINYLYFYLKMLHEILFALLGHTGSIIIDIGSKKEQMFTLNQTENKPKFVVNPTLNFLSQAEIE